MPVQASERLVSAFFNAAFAACVVALAVLALLPAAAMTRSSLGGHVEHFIAYLGTAIVMGLAFRRRPRLVLRCALLAGYAAVLETGQLYSPGRHASFEDFAFSASGVVVGGLLLWMMLDRLSAWLSKRRLV